MRDIKASAAKGNQASVKQLAKSLVRLRAQIAKLTASDAHLRGVRANLSVLLLTRPCWLAASPVWPVQLLRVSPVWVQSVAATSTVAGAMQSATGAMSAVGGLADPVKMQQQMAAFARENERMDMAADIMEDAFEDDEDEADEIVDQVCLRTADAAATVRCLCSMTACVLPAVVLASVARFLAVLPCEAEW